MREVPGGGRGGSRGRGGAAEPGGGRVGDRRGRRRGGRRGRGRGHGRGRGRGHGLGRRGLLVHGDPEVGGDARETVGVPLADRAHLPDAAALVDLDDDERGLRAQLRRGEGGDHRAAVGVAHGAGGLDALEGLPGGVGAGGDHDPLDARGQGGRVHGDRVRCRTPAGPVADTGPGGLVEEDEVGVGAHLAVRRQEQGRYVEPYRRSHVDRHADGIERQVGSRGHSGHARRTTGGALPFPYPRGMFRDGRDGSADFGGDRGRRARCRTCTSFRCPGGRRGLPGHRDAQPPVT